MPDSTHINPHLEIYCRGMTHGCAAVEPLSLPVLQEFRRTLDLGCYGAEDLDELMDELVAFVRAWVAEHPPLED